MINKHKHSGSEHIRVKEYNYSKNKFTQVGDNATPAEQVCTDISVV